MSEPIINELAFIDLSSIAHPIWHMSQGEPDPDAVCTKIVARVRALAANHPHAAVCCDSGKSFRKDLNADYKAQRPTTEAPLLHQIRLARERLAADGFPVWAVAGFEADDLIASATARTLAMADVQVLIISADKDLLQLVGPRVRAMSSIDGSIRDEAAVVQKFGIRPDQMCEFLMLVGDASDNVKGATRIGPKTAAGLLSKHGTLAGLYAALSAHGTEFTPSLATSLREFEARMPQVRQLIALRSDVEIPFEEIAVERVPKDAETFGQEEPVTPAPVQPELLPPPVVHPIESGPVASSAPPESTNGQAGNSHANGNGHALVRQPDVVLPAPADWDKRLEPRSMPEAIALSKHMFESRLFSAYGTPQAVLSTVMAGAELGMSAMASLRGFDIIDGRPTFKADLIRALILKSGKATYFRCTARSAEAATFVTQRGDEPPIELTYTIAEGRQAWSKTEDGWNKSGWGKNPADMLIARAGAKLARLVYPDVVHGLYAPEEFE